MPWQYSQTKRQLTWNGNSVGTGYSGSGAGQNNPQFEASPDVGPLPRGRYRIGPAHTHASKGPVVMRLTPVGHTAHGRSGFLIHGDSIRDPGNASTGCIVLKRTIREQISASHDTVLEVIE